MAPPGHRAVGWLVTILVILEGVWSENLAPKFASDGNLRFLRIPENTPVETSVYTLKAEDPEGLPVEYGIQADFLKVNRFTGEVRVSRQIDYESAPSFNVLIIASDGVSETKLSVPIQVIDANDEQPRFTRDIYKQSIDENAPVGTTVMRDLAITDKDTVNSLIEVRCAREKIVDVDALDTCDKFGLRTLAASNLNWTGVLVLQQSLDFESQRSYQVPLESFDGNPQNNVTVSVEITVNPVQDAPPRWLSAPNSLINENVPMGHPVTKVIAVDGDEGNPRPIRYEIYSNPGNYFTINDTTGQISTRRLVDRESGDFNQGFVLLSLRARELIRGPPERLGDDALTTATVTIRVRVEDLNDNPPRFDQSSYTVSIPEDIPTGTALPGLFMTVTDSDSGAGTAYTFTLLNHTREFEIFPGQGQGTTTVSMNVRDTNLINYETGPREYVMTIIAREVGTPELYSSQTTVTVRVTDVNDNLPEFIPPSYVASVREDARRGTPVLTVTAVDNDLTPSLGTDSIRFSLSGTDSNRFQINSITGEVEVSFCATPGTRPCIDYEQLKFYELVVTAKDQNGAGQDVPAKLRVDVLDVNDNQPRFLINNYGSTIMEGETLPVPEVKVQASDRDENSNIRYSVVSQDGTAGLFQIDPVSGFINAVRNVRFNDTQPNTDEIKITVRAFDGVFSNTALVTIIVIDVNDGPPKFIDEIYRASIPETTKGVVTVTSVSAIDVDSTGSITYEISSGDQDKFDINKNTGDITTTPNSTFNFDMQPEYRMLIKARDEGSPQMTGTATVIVTILDRNNRNPYFQPANLRAQVYENVQVGHVVRTISGQDPDKTADLYYYFGTPKRAYSPTGGEVNQTVYNFTNLFTIGERSGIVQTAAKLSRDETSLITYPLVVIDRGAIDQTGTGTLIIDVLDVNDKAPVFKPPWTVGNPVYYQDLDEERPQNTFVRVMVATDPDGAIDRYEMVWNPGQYFAVNRETGEVTINRRLDFDYDKANPQPKTFNFTVRAYDNGLTPLYSDASVVVNLININDNNPRFASPTYSTSIKESGTPGGSKPGDFIIRVQASDLDAGLYGDVYYGLQPTETRFAIDRTSGNITLLANDIDREKISDITFQALAYDSDPADQRTSSVQIYVRIDDINDNPPVFTKPVYERTIPEIFGSSQAILQLSATDKDISDRDNLRYEPANRTGNVMFYIDPTSGFVTPTRTLQGRSGTYEMSVVVKDSGGVSPYLFDTAIMRVIVQAVTNHPPRWVIPPRDNMTIFVLEEQYLGMIVYDVYANDTDSGANAIVEYAFETARSDNETRTKEFRINPITGVIRAERVFDREERDRYTLVLVARDRGGLKNTIFLRIVIKDVNDHLPRFAPQEYSKSIPEDKPLGSLVLALTATDADQTPSAQTVFYKIIAGNEDEMFLISATTGMITLNKPLDAEKKRSYTLEVMGYNNVSDYSVISKRSQPQNIATVFIIVTDTNDNAPVFTEASYFSCVSTGAALESSIVAVTAVDTDSQSVLSYKMLTLDDVIRKYFSVNNRTGVISNRMLMGDFAGQTFTFDVQVTDGRSTANTSVTLFVTSPDDEAMIVLAQPPDEVRTIQDDLERKLAVLLTEHNRGTVVRVCISRIENHIGADVSINTAWSDVYFNGMYMETTRKYTAFTDVDLTTRTQEIINDVASRDELSIFYIREVTAKSAASGESVFLSLPALVVMIIVIILLILALLLCLCCCCCYNPRRHRKDKEKLIGGAAGGYTIEEHRSGQFMSSGGVAHVDSSFHQAQGYENKGYVAETSMVQQAVADPVYATVQKKSRTGTMETVERLETQQAMETHEAMEAHEHLESVLREESSQPRTVESHSETTIITEVVPDEEVRGPDVRIITEPITDEEMAAQGAGREFHLVRQDATDTQGIEVEFSDSPGASASFSPGHTTTVHEYREETVRTEM